MDALVGLLREVPATFWGVVAGSLFTLIGVWLTNRAQDRRQQAQLVHERNLKAQERELNLRKDIYIGVAEAIAAGLAFLSKLADLETPQRESAKAYLDGAPKIAKANLVANEETMRHLSNYNAEYMAVMSMLLAKRAPLLSRSERARNLMFELQSVSENADRTVKQMTELRLANALDVVSAGRMAASLSASKSQMQEIQEEHRKAVTGLAEDLLAFGLECHRETGRLSLLVIPLVGSARRELQLPYDEAAHRAIAEEAQARLGATFERFLSDVASSLVPKPSA